MSTQHDSCAGTDAVQTLTTNIRTGMHAGDTVTVQWTTRPGCEAQTIDIAGHATTYDHFEAAETQPLIDSHGPQQLGAGGTITWAIPAATAPGCHVQIDIVTGRAIPVVDTAHRYNKAYFGLAGGNDLLAAAYADDTSCTAMPPATASTVRTTTTLTPITVAVGDPIPSTTVPSTLPTPAVDGPVGAGPIPPGPGTTLLSQCVTSTGAGCPGTSLPVTGGDTFGTVLVAVALFAVGAALLAAGRRTARRPR